MGIRKKGSILLTLILAVSLLLTFFFQSVSSIKANEGEVDTSESVTDGSTQIFDLESELTKLPETEEDLHAKEEITVDDMEAHMAGTNFQNPQARTGGKITGAMTQSEYTSLYGSLNQTQNDAWNVEHGFNPNYNVKIAFTWNEFKAYFEDNTVSKIILGSEISHTSSVALYREQSLEIDGQGNKLYIYDSSLNFTNLTKLSDFNRLFSNEPVFHMHDIHVSSATRGGEGTGTRSRSFINGDSASVRPTSNRQLWHYRIGNIYTPRTGTGSDTNLIQGRFIRANQAEISLWGYNDIVTGAENFYTGGIKYEPYTFYKGANANYNYSTIWFTNPLGDSGVTDYTGDNNFIVGEGSFVYLNNIGTGDDYPGIYEYWGKIVVGKSATLNVNVPGIAIQYNRDDATFIGEEGSTVNLLSRSGASTISFKPAHTTHGSESNPSNGTFEMMPKSNLFVVGSKSTGIANNQGVISFGGLSTRATNNRVILDGLESFDIRNTAGSNNAFLGDNSNNRGQHSFNIRNSDISIWNTGSDIDGAPTYDYLNVGEFTVTNASANGGVSSTDPALASQYTRPGFKRISGMNSIPLLTWTPVTNADYSQRSTILLGHTAVGGSDPFDENGDARTKPVYADGIRKAYASYTDTLGNRYVGMSTSDGFIHWNPTTNAARGSVFQLAGQDMIGTPFRASIANGTLTPYRTGEDTLTTVLDVTPPVPATLVGDKVTNATKQLMAEDLEPEAKVFVSIDGGTAVAAGSVGADGNWSYDLQGYLSTGQTVVIYLQDNGTRISNDIAQLLLHPILPTTNTNSGNINPYPSSVTYSDATFQPAKMYTVVDVIPDNPKLTKSVISSAGSTTSVGDVLTYTLIGKNDKAGSEDWADVVLEDTLPVGMDFNPANHGITIKTTDASGNETDIALTDDLFDYNETTRILTVKIGNVPALNGFVVTFKTTVNKDKIGQDLLNTAEAKGYSPQEDADPFIPGPINPDGPFKSINVIIDSPVGVPGGEIHGVLELVSAPDVINFKKHAVTMDDTRVEEPELSAPLTVSDNRGTLKNWTLTAKLTGVMTNTEDNTKVLNNVLLFNNGTTEEALSDAGIIIKQHTHTTPGNYVVSDDWSNGGTGIKLVVPAGSVNKLGEYRAEITWLLGDTYIPTP